MKNMFDNAVSVTINQKIVSSLSCNGGIIWNATITPEQLTMLQYIESTGVQVIDSGINPSLYQNGIIYDVQATFTAHSEKSTDYLFGCLTEGKRSGNIGYYEGNTSQTLTLLVGGSGSVIKNIAYPGNNVPCSIQATLSSNFQSKDMLEIFVNGTLMQDLAVSWVPSDMPNNNIFIFACNLNGNISSSTSSPATARLFHFKMYSAENNQLIRNFLPCRFNVTQEVGLYDTVTKRFYRNKGEAVPFIPGPELLLE